jgi:UDPglucose 6-dehydrogenase
MQIAIVGSGYVGLVSGACFADFGHDVVCVDKAEDKISALKAGRIPIFEPGLDEVVARNAAAGRLSFTTDLQQAVSAAKVVFIAVGTPSRRGDGHADLSYVYNAAREIAGAISGFTVVVTKSTVPVGTGDEVERIIRALNPRANVAVVSNPEFLREGAAIEDFKRPDRVVIGVNDEPGARQVMTEVYRPLGLDPAALIFTSRRTSELIKYAANAFLAMKITFINEVSDLCENVGASVRDVALGIGLDKRIGAQFLRPGPGYGGSCFPKDTLALVKTAQDAGSPLRLIETTVSVNDQRKRAMARRLVGACGGSVRGKTIALLGLTFKANTDDMREAPSLSIAQALIDMGAKIRAYDPEGMAHARTLFDPSVDYAQDPYACASGADALLLVTEWDEFRALDLERLADMMRSRILVDLRNVYAREEVARSGFHYVNIGEGVAPVLDAFSVAAE